ncbi:MAG: hypothetical protein ABIZ81_00490, partial [Opitutaceae bacterium]
PTRVAPAFATRLATQHGFSVVGYQLSGPASLTSPRALSESRNSRHSPRVESRSAGWASSNRFWRKTGEEGGITA